MPFRYGQATGEMRDPQGRLLATGYSGNGAGVNNPEMEHVPDTGPIPRGEWMIGPAFTHGSLGPVSMRLQPHGHKAHGRFAFLIHGDNGLGNRSASHGCIILPRSARVLIDCSPDHVLIVE